jgi:hypothetical protein
MIMSIQRITIAHTQKKHYTKPQLLKKGTVATLTLKAGGSSDGGIPGVFTP